MAKPSPSGWNPYLAGALTGLLMVASVWLSGHYFGASTTFVRYAGFLEKLVAPERVAQLPYFARFAPTVDWQFMLILGIPLGSFLAAVLFREFRLEAVPPMWAERFGPGAFKRGAVAFLGGVVAMFGARLADG